MILAWLAALHTVACTPQPPPPAKAASPAAPSLADDLERAIEQSDLPLALSVLCEGYAQGGMPCADTVRLELLGETDVMAHVDEMHVVHMTPMPGPGKGFAYWDNWARILSSGGWQPRHLFHDDDDARRVANMLLVTVLAHELGHHVAERFGCHPFGPARELRADELSLPLVTGMFDARLSALHTRMRAIADEMIAAVPEASRVGESDPLPKAVPSYVALHLSRQRRLLAGHEPFASVANRLCLVHHREWMASRYVGPGKVRTLTRLPDLSADKVALDREGGVHSVAMFLEEGAAHIRTLAVDGRELRVELPEAEPVIADFAAFNRDRFLLSDGSQAWQIDSGRATSLGHVPDGAQLAFDPEGKPWMALRVEQEWRVGPFGAPARFVVPIRDDRWGDGALASASSNPTVFAVGRGEIVFYDAARHALRLVAGKMVTTLAGGLSGRHDGTASEARFFDVSALAIRDSGGGVELAEPGVLRIVRPDPGP